MAEPISFGKKIIVTDDGKKYEKAGPGRTTGAIIAASFAGGAVITVAERLSSIPLNQELRKNFPQDSFSKAFEKAFQHSGLKEKGVEVINATAKNEQFLLDKMKDSLSDSIKKAMSKSKIIENRYTKSGKSLAKSIVNGTDALFSPKGNFIAVNKEKCAIALFHEMGHALNQHMKGIGKLLSKIRNPFALLITLAISTALFKRKKVDGEKPKNSWDKFTTFVKNHCGTIAFVGTLPTLAEEGLASIKGVNAAKPFLDKASLQKLKTLNAKAFLTYAGRTLAVGLGTMYMSKLRDEIAQPKEISTP